MSIRIHDTLRGEKVELTLRDPGRVSMYVCGPTVYDDAHVGHGRTAVVYDVVRRYLRWSGLEVTFVSNVTDVDDKIIARAEEAESSESELAARYEAAYWEQMDRLGVLRPDVTPHATEHIESMLALVGQLLDSDHAYVIDGQGVYFDVMSFPGYGALAHRSIAQLLESAGARVEVDEAKRGPLDFVLWKAAKPGEPAWDSPWGRGRPGWHIECSTMSLGLLGDGFDLHGAGNDLVFPHHENERAQAEAAGHPFSRHWIHAGMVEVGGEKMSKSLGNFTTLAEALDAHSSRAFRLAVLQSQYQRPMELGAKELTQAAQAVKGFDALARRVAAAGVDLTDAPLDDEAVARFRAAMDDDFATPKAMAIVSDLARAANTALDDHDNARAASLLATVLELTGVLGLAISGSTGGTTGDDAEISAQIGELVAQRDEARRAREFATADRIRDELLARGITLEDTPSGTIWHQS